LHFAFIDFFISDETTKEMEAKLEQSEPINETFDMYKYNDYIVVSHCINDDKVSFIDIIAELQDSHIPTATHDYLNYNYETDWFWNEFTNSEAYSEVSEHILGPAPSGYGKHVNASH
jgi:hypothetical protein